MDCESIAEYHYRPYDGDSLKPDPCSKLFLDHVSRYWWAAGFTAGKRVLDCATGSGYGAYVLSRNAGEALGIDLNRESLGFGRAMFVSDNLAFQEWDVLQLARLGRRFDVVTAFEIIEHLPAYTTDLFVAGIVDVLEPGGLALFSTPNHDVVMKSGVAVPEYHVNNFRPCELRRVLRRHFPHVRLLGQFEERPVPGRWLFAVDFYNLRHVLHRRLTRLMRTVGRRPADSPRSNRDAVPVRGVAGIDGQFFGRPCPGMERYRFSRWHWRQGGITVALCVK